MITYNGDVSMENASVLQTLREIYYIRQYVAVVNIFNSVSLLTETTTLTDNIREYLDRVELDDSNTPSADAINIIISDYVTVEIINKECGLLTDPEEPVDIYFIAGLLEFHSNINTYSPFVTPEIHKILDTDESDSLSKLGYIIELYQSSFYPLDIHHLVMQVPNQTIISYKEAIEKTMESANDVTDQITDLYAKLTGVNPDLIVSSLFQYIVRHNQLDIAETTALSYIKSRYETTGISDFLLAVELTTLATIFNKDSGQMLELLDTLYPENNTAYVVNYLNTNLGAL